MEKQKYFSNSHLQQKLRSLFIISLTTLKKKVLLNVKNIFALAHYFCKHSLYIL